MTGWSSSRQPIRLSRRKVDWVFLVFFAINLLVITYIVDFEQLVIADVSNFKYPLWPPKFMVDIIHTYGHTYDPLQIARPPFWKATIWIDALLFGPYYVFAIYAFWKGRDWIRIPTIIYATMLFTNVVMILSEEIWGIHRSPQLAAVIALNLPWLLIPIALIARMWPSEHPFTAIDERRAL